MKAIIYCRKSTDREDKQQLSLSAQVEEANKIAHREGFEVVQVIEESMSAKNPGRVEFAKMMQMIYDGKAEVIITWKLNRLARNPVDEGTIKWAIQNGQIKEIHTADGIFKTGDNVLIMGMYFGMSNQYILELKKDVERGMKKKLNDGGVVQKAPIGYINNKITHTVEIDPEKGELVKKVFEMRAEGVPISEIAERCFKLGLKTKTGKKLSKGQIDSMIKKTFYYGVMKFAGELYKGSYTPLVSKDLWEKANEIKRGISTKTTPLNKIPLKGIIKHKETGRQLSASIVKGKYVYYHTHGKYKDDGSIWINQNQIIEYFDENIGLYSVPEEFKEEVKKGLKDFYGEEYKKITNSKSKITKKTNEIEGKKKSLLEMRIEGELTKDEYSEMKNKYLLEELHLNEEKERLITMDDHLLESANKSVELLTTLSTSWKSLDKSSKAEVIKIICVELILDNEKRLQIAESDIFESLRMLNICNWQTSGELIRTNLERYFNNLTDKDLVIYKEQMDRWYKLYEYALDHQLFQF